MEPEESLEGREFFRLSKEEEFEIENIRAQLYQEKGPEDEEDEEEDDDFGEEFDDDRTYVIPGDEEEIIRREDEDAEETGLNKEYF